MTKTNFSKGERRMFGLDLDTWNSVMLVSLAIAALGAVAVVVSTTVVIKLQKQEANDTAEAFSQYKIEAGIKIAEATEGAANAKARGDIALADSSKANERAKSLEVKAEELREKNLAFEKAISPRVLEQALTGQKLKSYSDIEVVVVSSSDSESRRTAEQIRYMLRGEAGWKKFSGHIPRIGFFDGVVVHTSIGEQRTREAAEMLVEQLTANGIEAKTGYPIEELGKNGILVIVGSKPVPPALQRKAEDVPADSRGNKVWGNMMQEE
jgi:hypothetical protein